MEMINATWLLLGRLAGKMKMFVVWVRVEIGHAGKPAWRVRFVAGVKKTNMDKSNNTLE